MTHYVFVTFIDDQTAKIAEPDATHLPQGGASLIPIAALKKV